jgi:Icc-related predicted phosphoesterase
MKLLVLADVEESHWKHGKGDADVLLSCGNVPDAVILEAAEAHECKLILAVKGSNDSSAPFNDPIINIHLRTTVCNGIAFGGLNGAVHCDEKGPYRYKQEEITEVLEEFRRVDVLVAHNSPRRVHDKKDEPRHGFEGISAYITRVIPELVIHGFQHSEKETKVGETKVIGVCGHKFIEMRTK